MPSKIVISNKGNHTYVEYGVKDELNWQASFLPYALNRALELPKAKIDLLYPSYLQNQ